MPDTQPTPQPAPQPTPQPTDNPTLPDQNPSTVLPPTAGADIDASKATGESAIAEQAGALVAGRP